MGTDYGRGITNIDTNTGIRYGVIPSNPDWLAYFLPPAIIDCPNCGNEISEIPENLTCSHCEYVAEDEQEFYPDYYDGPRYYEDKDYSCMLDSSGDVWVFKSPWKVKAGYCSPCAPGAIYLTDTTEDDYGYALGPEWFDENEMPYTPEKV
jgi:hypothetical protein